MVNIRIVAVAFTLISCYPLLAQRNLPMQYLANPSSGFAALAGYHGATQANLFYRNEYPGIPSTNVDYGVGVDGFLDKANTGVGLILTNERFASGLLFENRIEFKVAPRFELSDKLSILTGLSAGWLRTKLNFANLTYCLDCPEYPKLKEYGLYSRADYPLDNVSKGFSIAASAGLKYQSFLVVAQVYTDNQTPFYKNSPIDLPTITRAMAMIPFSLIGNVELTTSLLYENHGVHNLIGGSATLRLSWFSLMGSYRYKSDGIKRWLVGSSVNIGQRVLVSYSYDVTNNYATMPLGSHEFGIRTTLFKNKAKDVLIENLPMM